MSTITATINGHNVSNPLEPAHKQNSPIWVMYFEVVTLNAAFPLIDCSAVRTTGKTFTITITPVDRPALIQTIEFDDPVNPLITFNTLSGWRERDFSQTLSFLNHLHAWLAQDAVDSASWVVT